LLQRSHPQHFDFSAKDVTMSGGYDEQVLNALTALKNGDFSVRLPTGQEGTAGEIAQTFNSMLEQLTDLSNEIIRIANELGPEGKWGGQVVTEGLSGTWAHMKDAVNQEAALITDQLRTFCEVTYKLGSGKPTSPAAVPANGEAAILKELINKLVQQYGTMQEKA
jgi:methyl-accepting chemotaxis protein